MPLISFKDLKLFKVPTSSSARRPPKEGQVGCAEEIFRNPFFLIAVSALVLASVLSYLPSKTLSELKPGDIAPEDLVAPADLTIEDTETTDLRRREAVAAILPVYNLDPNVMLNTADHVRQFFAFGREWLKNPRRGTSAALRGAVQEQFGLELGLDTIRALEREEFRPGA